MKRFVVLVALFTIAFEAFSQKATKLDSVFAPVVVGVPPSDAYIGLAKMPDGELRHYNYGEQKLSHAPMYLSSRDSGFTWREVRLPEDIPFADTPSPLSGEYIRAVHSSDAVYVIRTDGGIDGGRTITKIDSTIAIMLKPPVFVEGGKRIVIAGHGIDRKGCFTYVSDDDGRTWQKSNTVNSPAHEKGGHHKGVRWNHGAVEPTVAEIDGGKLWMVMRTAQDRHYQSFSEDGGLNWSEPTPSPFYGTITMPTFFRMGDGRLLFFWSNTTPLPEMESATGVWDDVFTNRNASHVAISEDNGQTWIGMRELILDQGRNARDFASSNGIDKSVHQAQAVEVAPGKILVSLGQNTLHRKMLLFDVDWLYENSRESDFTASGLGDWSAFRYYKGIVGHCGYNRQEMPLLMDHPDKKGEKVIKIGYTPNDSLVQDADGAVWNFPSVRSGRLVMRFSIQKGAQGVNLILNDRWFNPTDHVATEQCIYNIGISRDRLSVNDEKWHELLLVWKEGREMHVFVDGEAIGLSLPMGESEHGVSYLHLLGGSMPDSQGVLFESVRVEKID